jgi:hypothetical protein
MRKLFIPLFSAALIGASACSNDMIDVDAAQFSRLADVDSMQHSRIIPAQSYQYWELRYSFGPGSGVDRLLGSGGTRTFNQLAESVQTALRNTTPNSGFSSGCLPAHCFLVIVAVDQAGTVSVVQTRDALLAFLGTLETVEEAALVVRSYNLHWDARNINTGYRAVDGGWEFLTTQLVRDCQPVQTDRVHVLVRPSGALKELGREVLSRLENACV